MDDYGEDFSCFDEQGRFRANLAKLITGKRVVFENVAKVCFTSFGALFWDPNVGINADDLVNAQLRDSDIPSLQQKFSKEARRISGVLDARAQITKFAGAITIAITVQLRDGVYPLLIRLDQAAAVLFPGVS